MTRSDCQQCSKLIYCDTCHLDRLRFWPVYRELLQRHLIFQQMLAQHAHQNDHFCQAFHSLSLPKIILLPNLQYSIFHLHMHYYYSCCETRRNFDKIPLSRISYITNSTVCIFAPTQMYAKLCMQMFSALCFLLRLTPTVKFRTGYYTVQGCL